MKRTIATIAAMSAACVLFADDEAEETAAEETAAEETAETAEALPAVPTNSAPVTSFTTLPLCRHIQGTASVRKPGKDWEIAEEGRFYPLGSSYRAEKGSSLVVSLGRGSTVSVADGAAFGTREQPLGTLSRTLVLMHGAMTLRLPDNLPEGVFFVTAPGFTIKNPAGESVITYEDLGDGDVATVLCKTGSFGIEGRHFDIPAMHVTDEVRIRTSKDHLFTSLYGTSGNYVVNLDQGMCMREEFGDDGMLKTVVEKGTLAWHLSPRTHVVINRAVPAIGERMSVHTMTFDARGALKNERVFCEGRAEVNSGELAPQEKAKAEELAKRAAEMTEAPAAANKAEDASAEGGNSEETTSNEEE